MTAPDGLTTGDAVPIVVVGETHLVEGFALGGAEVVAAETPGAVQQAWLELPGEAIVVLTPAAARAVGELGDEPATRRLRVVMPE